jgi:hypothetical protein
MVSHGMKSADILVLSEEQVSCQPSCRAVSARFARELCANGFYGVACEVPYLRSFVPPLTDTLVQWISLLLEDVIQLCLPRSTRVPTQPIRKTEMSLQ